VAALLSGLGISNRLNASGSGVSLLCFEGVDGSLASLKSSDLFDRRGIMYIFPRWGAKMLWAEIGMCRAVVTIVEFVF
jgi:hypothetical protein